MADKQRALAHVEKIVNIQPIEGADNIELITLILSLTLSNNTHILFT